MKMILAENEAARLADLESVIARGKQTFIEVGVALAEIRSGRLYRATHSTFEAYCQAKWSFSRQYANQLIAGSAAVGALPPGMETLVSNGSAARALSRVPATKRVEVLQAASANGAASAREIEKQHATLNIQPATAEPARVQTADEQLKDALGPSATAALQSQTEPDVKEYYDRLKLLAQEAFSVGSDKQLNSFSVAAKEVLGDIKAELKRRAAARKKGRR